MKYAMAFFAASVCALLAVGAAQDGDRPEIVTPVAGPPVPWTDKELNNDPGTFHFAIISDLAGGERPGVFEDAVAKLNLLQPEFVVSIGDLIQGYTDNPRTMAAQWKSFDDRLSKLQMRFFRLPGNHDIGGPAPEAPRKVWAERFGPSCYHFVYRDVLFLCLNSEMMAGNSADPAETAKQIAYVRKALADNAGVRWTFVFLHHPLWIVPAGPWAEIDKLLAARKHTVFCGHIHRYTKYTRHGQSYINLATTGGATGPAALKEGRFDHVAWVTMKPDGPVVANVILSGVADENVVTEEMVRARLRGGN